MNDLKSTIEQEKPKTIPELGKLLQKLKRRHTVKELTQALNEAGISNGRGRAMTAANVTRFISMARSGKYSKRLKRVYSVHYGTQNKTKASPQISENWRLKAVRAVLNAPEIDPQTAVNAIRELLIT